MDQMITNIKNKNLAHTVFGSHIYSNLWYADTKNKICITFTPRGGCSIAFQQYLDLCGLLDDGLNYHPFIHTYRCEIFDQSISQVPIEELQYFHEIKNFLFKNYLKLHF
jgi:hypothetical protein